jgi:broad specificity polyphosphatase/5'/3'-nucleotidase SurE
MFIHTQLPMTIILTSDDGIDAPGIPALVKAINGKNTIIAAPKDHQSGYGYGYQVTTTHPISLQRRSETEYAIAGTPADWDLAARFTAEVLADLLNRPLEPGSFWKVNLPQSLTRRT